MDFGSDGRMKIVSWLLFAMRTGVVNSLGPLTVLFFSYTAIRYCGPRGGKAVWRHRRATRSTWLWG